MNAILYLSAALLLSVGVFYVWQSEVAPFDGLQATQITGEDIDSLAASTTRCLLEITPMEAHARLICLRSLQQLLNEHLGQIHAHDKAVIFVRLLNEYLAAELSNQSRESMVQAVYLALCARDPMMSTQQTPAPSNDAVSKWS